jgi:ATP-dependent Lon protease
MVPSKYDDDLDPPTGFALHRVYVSLKPFHHVSVNLLIPMDVKAELELQALQRDAQRLADDMAEEEQNTLGKGDASGAASPLATSDPRANATGADAWSDVPPLVAGQDYDPKLSHPVYAIDTPAKLLARAGLTSPDREVRKRDEQIGNALQAKGALRDIAVSETALDALEALRESLPNFAAAIDLVRGQLLLAARTRKGPRIPPILLDGEPGLGKTHFAIELAKALGTTVRRIAFDSPISGATLLGSERRWSNTQCGALFELVCLGQHANPIVILDEIDKAETRRDWDPLAPLHTLLEPSTATQVRDISVDVEFDASLVTWIATSNDRFRLPASLRSRFREFPIARPEALGAIQSARSVVAKTLQELALVDFEVAGRRIAVHLAHLTPREVRQAVEKAVASAVADGRDQLTADDLPVELPDGYESLPSYPTKPWRH